MSREKERKRKKERDGENVRELQTSGPSTILPPKMSAVEQAVSQGPGVWALCAGPGLLTTESETETLFTSALSHLTHTHTERERERETCLLKYAHMNTLSLKGTHT